MEMNEKPAKKPKRANSWECTYMGCDRTFRHACKLKEHTDYVHKKIYHHRCDHVGENGETCGKTCATTGDLNQHKKKHNPELKIPCPCCTRTFWNQCSLQEHMDFVAGIFNHICDHIDKNGERCGYKCEKASHLATHKKKHNPDLKIPCVCCIRRFRHQWELQSHVDFVAGIFNHICDHIDKNGKRCGYKCEKACGLEKHKMRHNPELMINCQCCTRRFECQSYLRNHVDYVAGIFHNVCEYVDNNGETCGKTFEQAGALKDHKKIHIRDAQRDMALMEDHHVLETPHTVQRWE